MCFSATASFIAGAALSAAGVVTLRMATRRSEIPFAAIPLLFGIQQLTEGLVWLSLRDGSALPGAALTFVYSLFSHALWPLLVPFAAWLLETVAWRRNVLVACQLAGAFTSVYLTYFIVRFPVTARMLGGHIVYDSPHFYVVPVLTLYLTATCVSSVFASRNGIRVFGLLLLATFLAALAVHVATMVSVWCFFAAVSSLVVLAYFVRERRVVSGRVGSAMRQA